jgi:hypothetical protein
VTDQTTLELRKTATVSQTPAEAFALFTEHMAVWWPLASHSVGLDQATSVEVEPGVGGRIIETLRDGTTSVWGTIDVWEPPARIRFSWHPGTPEAEATSVEVLFHASGAATTVELIHTGWDRRSDAAAMRRQYDSGWDYVFGLFAAAGEGSLVA